MVANKCQAPLKMEKKMFLFYYQEKKNLVATKFDALPSSWIDANVNLKWKQRKNQELGHAPWFIALSGVEGCARAPGWD
jgi:hypothetical protein